MAEANEEPRLGLETLGNATLVFSEDGRPVLATDPWLTGTCYFGSWALDRPLTRNELDTVLASEYIWISHGHPDHFHPQSLALLPRGKKILLPDHYSGDIASFLTAQGFAVEILRYRHWRSLSLNIRCLCLDNENQDAILIVEAGKSLVVDLNDSPLCGERRFIRRLVRQHERRNTYVAALCSNDADMLNIVDEAGNRVIDAPERRKPGMVWALARTAESLGVGTYMSSASQHIYARRDSVWANPYRVGWADVQRYWTRPDIRIVESFVVLDLATGDYVRKHPSQKSDESQITDATERDDWSDRLGEAEWSKLFKFFQEIETLPAHLDYVDFTVGGERRRIWLDNSAQGKRDDRLRGIGFHAPRNSLMRALEYGYFDDMLIGNFMRTELHNAGLYPHFTPLVAKLRGSARVSTLAELRRFRMRYFKRNPLGMSEWWLANRIERLGDFVRRIAELIGLKRPLARIYRRLLGDPVG
jgi:hypothetical protein